MKSSNGSIEKRLNSLFPAAESIEDTRKLLLEAIDVLNKRLEAIPSPNTESTYVYASQVYNTEFAANNLFLVKSHRKRSFILPFPDSLAKPFNRQWAVLPDEVANIPCGDVGVADLCGWLNVVFNTQLGQTPEVEEYLTGFIDDGYDFGEIYGYLRPWMDDVHSGEDFAGLSTALGDRRLKDTELRAAAVHGSYVTTPKIPPRRVWDLYSNRVLPYYALKPSHDPFSGECFPDTMWTVSHSWVSREQRQNVITPINGCAWPVPIPSQTTLEDIRGELLALGAEYVWLDVLCMRQWDERSTEAESVRKREWKLDVPTIGHVYNENLERAIIVYFNGLGLPFRDEPVTENDQFHWCNRAWTLQEYPRFLIPGGLPKKIGKVDITKETPSTWAQDDGFIRHFTNSRLSASHVQLKITRIDDPTVTELFMRGSRMVTLREVIEKLQSRFATNALDKISAIVYLLECPVRPIYDPDESVEVAWNVLVQCMSNTTRTHLLFADYDPADARNSWIPPWEQVITCRGLRQLSGDPSEDEQLKYLDGSSPDLGYRHGRDAYYHTAFVIENCFIAADATSQGYVVRVPLCDRKGHYKKYKLAEWGSTLQTETAYILIGVGNLDYFVVAQGKGWRRVKGERALEVSKVSTLKINSLTGNKEAAAKFKQDAEGDSQLVVY